MSDTGSKRRRQQSTLTCMSLVNKPNLSKAEGKQGSDPCAHSSAVREGAEDHEEKECLFRLFTDRKVGGRRNAREGKPKLQVI